MFKFLILSTFYGDHGDKNPFLYMFEFDLGKRLNFIKHVKFNFFSVNWEKLKKLDFT